MAIRRMSGLSAATCAGISNARVNTIDSFAVFILAPSSCGIAGCPLQRQSCRRSDSCTRLLLPESGWVEFERSYCPILLNRQFSTAVKGRLRFGATQLQRKFDESSRTRSKLIAIEMHRGVRPFGCTIQLLAGRHRVRPSTDSQGRSLGH